MKRVILLALLGGLSLTVQAQSAADNEVRVHGYQIELPATPHKMFRGDFDTYQGGYDLSNGAVLTLHQQGRRMYAQIGDGEQKELIAAKGNVFVALDRELKITLNKDNYGDFSGEVLMVVHSNTAQANAGEVIRLVSSR